MDIRLATIKDAKDILNIYSFYVENTNISFEYEIPSLEEMENRICNTLKNYPYIIATVHNKVIGYAYASAYHSRKAYDWDCELSIYVDEAYHGQNVAKTLYETLINILKIMNIQNVYACIVHPNVKSEAFHHRLGFKDVGIFTKSGYKFGKWHDVIWMEKAIGNYKEVKSVIKFSQLSKNDIEACLKHE